MSVMIPVKKVLFNRIIVLGFDFIIGLVRSRKFIQDFQTKPDPARPGLGLDTETKGLVSIDTETGRTQYLACVIIRM